MSFSSLLLLYVVYQPGHIDQMPCNCWQGTIFALFPLLEKEERTKGQEPEGKNGKSKSVSTTIIMYTSVNGEHSTTVALCSNTNLYTLT
ncbi:hypothetical protein XELAEV_18030999mg [Xenopus laevis]|uniref:Uncharacterized protein n=1 Tax=Xenopus laevis TaxID=8355 RepID=A0A974HF90_XENLA|nr:hypothetical protein XELAEV_18030999mg [Xenopus laevis]